MNRRIGESKKENLIHGISTSGRFRKRYGSYQSSRSYPSYSSHRRPQDDHGKARFDLLPPDALWELVRVYTFGASKYQDRNWEKGIKWGRVFAAICRHLFSWLKGEDLDPESGLHHLAHSAWGCLALLAYVLRGMTEYDDRGNH